MQFSTRGKKAKIKNPRGQTHHVIYLVGKKSVSLPCVFRASEGSAQRTPKRLERCRRLGSRRPGVIHRWHPRPPSR
ncbi:unnamed protein product [Ixodes persulcatus]